MLNVSFSEADLRKIFSHYGLVSRYVLLSDWHASTFEVYRGELPCILRISGDFHRSRPEIESEIEWMRFVKKGGLSVPGVYLSTNNLIAEEFEVRGQKFTAVLFEKLDGKPIEDSDWNPGFFEKWGTLVGQLHRLGKGYQTKNTRALWHESDFLNVNAYIPDELAEIREVAFDLIAEIQALPQNPSVFGWMHADVYQENMFITEDKLQLFDFDNSEIGFFVNDIAISLYAALWKVKAGEDRQMFAETFLQSFWKGYSQEFQLEATQLAYLPLFLRLRDLVIYIVTRKKRDLTRLTLIQARLLEERGRRISLGVPIVDVTRLLK